MLRQFASPAGRRQRVQPSPTPRWGFVAWIIGWDLILEFAVGAAVVAKGWSSYLGTVFGFAGGVSTLGGLQFDWGALLIITVVATTLLYPARKCPRTSRPSPPVKVSVVLR